MKTKFTAILFFATVFACLTVFKVRADDRMYPDLYVKITSNSDYYVYFSWDYSASMQVGNVKINSNLTYLVDIFKNSAEESNKVKTFSEEGHLLKYTVNCPVGPGISNIYALRYTEYNNSNREHAWSGFKKNDAEAWEPYAGTENEIPSLEEQKLYTNYFRVKTAPIKQPSKQTATVEKHFDKIVLTWEKATDITHVNYFIYRGKTNNPDSSEYISSVQGFPTDGLYFSWTDLDVKPNDEYFYWVCTRFINPWDNNKISISIRTEANAIKGSTKKALVLKASDGAYVNAVKLEWTDLSEYSDEIRIERSIPGKPGKIEEREELGIVSKYSRAFADIDAIPGYVYKYFISAIKAGQTDTTLNDTGFKKPNGIISGTVKSVNGTGVADVQVCAMPLTIILPGDASVTKVSYCDITDSDGNFEIRDIYYYDKAEFEVVPVKLETTKPHDFSPDTIKRTLDIQTSSSDGNSFTDNSVFAVSGKVTYPDDCPIEGVEILVNRQKRNIFTKKDGSWSTTLQDAGNYSFKPVYLHHQFESVYQHLQSDMSIDSIFIDDDVSKIDFTDEQKDSIMVKVLNGCGASVADAVNIQVATIDECYKTIFSTGKTGLLTIPDLSARKYTVKIVESNLLDNNIFSQIGDKPITVDFTVRDTVDVITRDTITTITPPDTTTFSDGSIFIEPADTVFITVYDTIREVVIPKADFIYHSPMKVTVDFAEAGAKVVDCGDPSNKTYTLMEKNEAYSLLFNIEEKQGACPVTEGELRIIDYISDRGKTTINVPIKKGIAIYTVDAGLPEFSKNDFKKLLWVKPSVGFVKSEPTEFWIVVTGVKPGENSGNVTISPDLPSLVVHDPPGDLSYAYVNKGTSITNFTTHEVLVGGEAGAYADLTFGYTSATFKAGGVVKFTLTGGRDNFNRDGLQNTLTFEETLSTSDMENLNGHNGDVL